MHPWLSGEYINGGNERSDSSMQESPVDMPKPRDSTGYLVPQPVRRPAVRGDQDSCFKGNMGLAATIANSPNASQPNYQPMAYRMHRSLQLPRRPLPSLENSGSSADAAGQPDPPPRDPEKEAAAVAAAPGSGRRPASRSLLQLFKPSRCSHAATLTVQLLMTLALFGYYFAWCNSGQRWIRQTISNQEEGCDAERSAITNEVVNFQPETERTSLDFHSDGGSVIVKLGGDYRIASKVCFNVSSKQEVIFFISINNHSDDKATCRIQEPGSTTGQLIHECCRLFVIKRLKANDDVSVKVSPQNIVQIDCRPSMSSFSLEKIN